MSFVKWQRGGWDRVFGEADFECLFESVCLFEFVCLILKMDFEMSFVKWRWGGRQGVYEANLVCLFESICMSF
jgi:hypothetical protein